MPKAKLFILGMIAQVLICGAVNAEPVGLHHSVTISATIIDMGKNGGPDGHVVHTITNAVLIKWAIKQGGDSTVKPSELDVVQNDTTGTIAVINRTTLNETFFYEFLDGSDTTETTSFSTTESTGFTQYRVAHGFVLGPPNEDFGGSCNVMSTTHLDRNSGFKSSTSVFTGGAPSAAGAQYVIKGTTTTGGRKYTF